MLPIIEIFDSIQGEGTMMGTPVTFIRVAGCNLKCPWCDTKYSWGIEGNVSMKLDPKEIVAQCNRDIVVITGGEPCLYDLDELIILLHQEEKIVCLETNGTKPTPAFVDWVVCSPKPQADYNIHPKCKFDELKYVVDENFDINVIPQRVRTAHIEGTKDGSVPPTIWLQPQGYDMDNSAQRAFELVMEYGFLRMGIQMHKLINVK